MFLTLVCPYTAPTIRVLHETFRREKTLRLKWELQGSACVPRITDLQHSEWREEGRDTDIYFMLIMHHFRDGHTVQLSHLVIDGHCNALPLGPAGLTGSFPQPWVGCWQKAEERGFCPQPHSPSRGWSTSNDQVTLRHESSAPCPSSGQPWRTSPASELPGSGEAFVEASS